MESIKYFKMDKVFKIVERISYHTKIINLNVSYYIELNAFRNWKNKNKYRP